MWRKVLFNGLIRLGHEFLQVGFSLTYGIDGRMDGQFHGMPGKRFSGARQDVERTVDGQRYDRKLQLVGKQEGSLLEIGHMPGKVRAPSGNTVSEVPSCSTFSACLMVSYTFRGLDLSTKMNPADSQAFPTNGSLRRLFFIIHLKLRPKKP